MNNELMSGHICSPISRDSRRTAFCCPAFGLNLANLACCNLFLVDIKMNRLAGLMGPHGPT